MAGRHLWADMVNQNEYRDFVNSGGGQNATYYDFQDWKRTRNSGSGGGIGNLADIVKLADPFASERGQYAQTLKDLLGLGSGAVAGGSSGGATSVRTGGMMRPAQVAAQPGGATSSGGGASRISDLMKTNPFFQANMDAGNEAAMRRLRAQGMGDSGNAAFELQRQGQANMSGEYWKMADLLGTLSGATQAPAAGANAALQLAQLNEQRRQFDTRYGGGGGGTTYSGSTRASIPGGSGMFNLENYWGAGR